ncbi:7022_t:CDS:2 [Dentiscutata heterogama]|uniref:7022_t:CDS:1 n=1 Tax=Dentiscutata heterogama TaxID=1316150 RepID=A0ACA9KBN1_9GLOM|nr:7022_t:CDS:2 [Dentiscutata heterogama]
MLFEEEVAPLLFYEERVKPYRSILEDNLWDAIMSRFADPDVSISFPILPSRKKVTVQLSSRKDWQQSYHGSEFC